MFDPFKKDKDPMDALSALKARVEEVLAPLGISVEQLWFAPGPGDGPHIAQGVFMIDRDAAFKSAEEKAMDDQFKEIALQTQVAERDEKAKEARSGLVDIIGSLTDGGILEEDDLEPGAHDDAGEN